MKQENMDRLRNSVAQMEAAGSKDNIIIKGFEMDNLKVTTLERMISIGKKNKRSKHLFRQRVLAGALCACLLTVSMPFSVLAAENSEAVQENVQKEIKENTHDDIHEIVSFTELPDEEKGDVAEDGAEEAEALPDVSGSTTPVCGVISGDTTWEAGTLSGGELIIKPEATLKINGDVTFNGPFTIKGGGTIRRGNRLSHIVVNADSRADVTVENITIDGARIPAYDGMIFAYGNLTICGGCKIENCKAESLDGGAIVSFGSLTIRDTTISNCSARAGGAICIVPAERRATSNRSVLTMEDSSIIDCSAGSGGAIEISGSSAILENITVENCSAHSRGGAICTSYYIGDEISHKPDLTIKDGKFMNNKTSRDGYYDHYGGGCIWVEGGILNICGGEFIGNTTAGRGGCIYQDTEDSVIHISGGNFVGNTCTYNGYEGSGAVYVSSGSKEQLILSSEAHFFGADAFGTDGIMLDGGSKVLISSTLNYPVTVYVGASEGRVIAEGTDSYQLSLEKDKEKVKFVDIYGIEGIYHTVLAEKNSQIKLSRISYYINYISNGAQGQVVDDTKYEGDDTITVKSADGLSLEGHRFTGWNTKKDGSGTSCQPGDEIKGLEEDITLYAQWIPDNAGYMVEHYLQDVSGVSYTKVEADTETLSGTVGEVVNAMPKTYRGFTENTTHGSRKEFGVVASDGSLVLRLYYDRDVYNITFDINGASGTAPEAQELRYGALLQEIDRPAKTGYTFLGWYMGEPGTEGKAWDFDKTVEENTEKKSETLYAGWVDNIAPVLMQAEFNEGYKSFHDWLIRKKDLIITIPIIEEGSGVQGADYVLSSLEKSDSVNESAQAQIIEEGGRTVAKITISDDFKGTVSMTCTDNAGNISAGKTLTSPSGGALIVEDNTPEIIFSSTDGSLSDSFYGDVVVTVSVNDEGTHGNADAAENAKITGGIASVTYRLDDGAETAVEGKGFESGIVASCDFSVEISGVGEHILKVTATDNAGNENTRQARIRIAQEPAQKNKIPVIPASRKKSPAHSLPALNPSAPAAEQLIALADLSQPLKTAGPVKDDEPRTGDDSCVDLYATIAILTGLFYLCYILRRKELE